MLIEVDGGINETTGAQVVAAGAKVLVAGTYIYKESDRSHPISTLSRLGQMKISTSRSFKGGSLPRLASVAAMFLLSLTVTGTTLVFGAADKTLSSDVVEEKKADRQVTSKDGAAATVQYERVGGEYKVSSIEKLPEGSFRIIFQAVSKTGQFDTLALDSDHVHVAVEEGTVLRLSAEVVQNSGQVATDETVDVSQVVLFFNSPSGRVPVWLLSNKIPSKDLRATDFLKMHVPLNDYFVL